MKKSVKILLIVWAVVAVVLGGLFAHHYYTTDGLLKDLKALYKADKGKDKAAHLGDLRDVYHSYSEATKFGAITTTGQLLNGMKASAKDQGIPVDALGGIRNRLALEHKKVLGNADQPLTGDLKAKAVAHFDNVAKTLTKVLK